MARPKAQTLTERELEVMHAFWRAASRQADQSEVAPREATAAEIRDQLSAAGRDLAYTTVATLIRILCDKGFLAQTNHERPFTYRPSRSFDEVSGSLVGDLVERLFGGQREQLLLRLLEERQLTPQERTMLQQILRDDDQPSSSQPSSSQPSSQRGKKK
ncbi:MAG: BlaI/MecI/CopY family transcriptional regulator [Pirellulaceae bacterium]